MAMHGVRESGRDVINWQVGMLHVQEDVAGTCDECVTWQILSLKRESRSCLPVMCLSWVLLWVSMMAWHQRNPS